VPTTSGAGRRRTKSDQRSEATREALLNAGRKLLLEQPASGVFSHLTAARVATAAGRTTGALFHQWPTLDDYLHDLLAWLFAPSESQTLAEFVGRVAASGLDGGTLATGLLDAARYGMQVLPSDPHSLAELLMWNRATRDEEFRAQVATLYPALDAVGGEFVEALLEATGREMRPPYTPQTLAALCSGVLQGLAIRTVITPDFYPPDAAGQILITLVPLFTRVPGDPADAADYTAAVGLDAPLA
jgi:AcrR family transcriptional regulator